MKPLHEEYARLLQQEPVHMMDGPGGKRYCIHRYEDVAAALKNQHFGAPKTPTNVLRLLRFAGLSALANAAQTGFFAALNPPDHTRIRKVLDPTFAPRHVKTLERQIETIVAQFLDRLEAREEFDLVSEFAAPLPAWVIADVFGFPPDEMDDVRQWTDNLLPMVDAETRGPMALLGSLIAFFRFRGRVLRLVAERKDNPKDDLLSALAGAHHGTGTLTRDEVVGAATLTLTAGHVTTRHLLTNSVHLLLQNPDVLAQAQQDPTGFDKITEEAIRLLSPLQTTGRVTTQDVEVAGRKIPAGSKIRLFLGAANHDPRRFKNPDKFDTERPNPRHLGFGGGIHYCIGIHLARVEVRIALRELFRRFPNLAAVDDGVKWGASRKFPGIATFRVRANG